LLAALNAACKIAARAGEQGREFAVVASPLKFASSATSAGAAKENIKA